MAGMDGIKVGSLTMFNFDLTKSLTKKADPDFMAKIEKIKELEYTKPKNLEDHPSQKLYAEVVLDGKTVAKLYNSGVMETSNAAYGKISKLDSVSDPQGSGPVLAQQRAEEIAKALGGTVVMSKDALTPTQWAKVPPVEFEVDYAAMAADAARESAEARDGSAETLVKTQIIATQQNEGAPEEPEEETNSVVDEFLEFASMSYEEKVRAMILKSAGVTEEELAAMSPEERAKIEEKIREKVEEAMANGEFA